MCYLIFISLIRWIATVSDIVFHFIIKKWKGKLMQVLFTHALYLIFIERILLLSQMILIICELNYFKKTSLFLFFLFSDSNVAGDSRRHWFSASFFTTAYNDCIRRQTHCIWRWTLHVKWLSIVDIRFTSEYRSDLIILVIK